MIRDEGELGAALLTLVARLAESEDDEPAHALRVALASTAKGDDRLRALRTTLRRIRGRVTSEDADVWRTIHEALEFLDRAIRRYPCPCCGCLTLLEPVRGSHELCPVCFWEDDGLQLADPDRPGGANDESLNEARANYRTIGACSPRDLGRVRPPSPEEKPS